MGLFDWVTRGELDQPHSTYEAAYGGLYASDLLRKAGLDPASMPPEQRRAAVEYLRKKAEQQYKEAQKAAKAKREALAWDLGSLPSPTALVKKAPEDVPTPSPPPFIIDDVSETVTGRRGQELRDIAAGIIPGPKESPLPVRMADRALRAIHLGAVQPRLEGVEEDPTKKRGKLEQIALQGAGLVGAGAEIAALSALGVPTPAAVGIYEAANPHNKSIVDVMKAGARGTAIGLGAEAFTALRSGILRTMFSKNPELGALVERHLVEGGVGRFASAGELGAIFTAGEKLARGEMPTLDDLLVGYGAFAAAHAPVEFAHSLKPQSRAFRRVSRELKEWEKSDHPDAVLARKMREDGNFKGYSEIIKGKMAERMREVLAKMGGRKVDESALVDRTEEIVNNYFDGLDEWYAKTKEKGLAELEQRNTPQPEPTPEEAAYAEKRKAAEEDVARRERQREVDQRLLAEQPEPRQLSRGEAVRLIAEEAGVSRNRARRILGDVRRQVSRGGRRYYDEGEVLTRARQEANRRVRDAMERNKRDILLKKYKTPEQARRAAKRAQRESGGEAYDIYEDADGTWAVRPRRQVVDARQAPEGLVSPERPNLGQRLKVAEEEYGIRKIGASGRAWAEKQRQIEAERRRANIEKGRRLREKLLSEKRPQKMTLPEGRTLKDVIDEMKARDPVARRIAEMEEAAARDAERARQKALEEGAMTAEQARKQRMEEAARRRAELERKRLELAENEARRAAQETVEDAAVLNDELPPEEIVKIAKEPGGMKRLKDMGYSGLDVLRAVHIVKTGAPPKALPRDEYIGFLLGGVSPETWAATWGLVESSVRGAMYTGVRIANGIVEGVNRSLTPLDLLLDSTLKRLYQNETLRGARDWTKKVGAEWARRVGVDKVFGERFFEALRVASLDYLEKFAPKIAESIRENYVATKHIATLEAQEKAAKLRKLLDTAQREYNRMRKDAGLRRLHSGEFAFINFLVYQYGKAAPDGSRPGLNIIADELRIARELGIDIEQYRPLIEEAVNVIRHLDEMPKEWIYAIEAQEAMFEADRDMMQNSGLLGQEYRVSKSYVDKSGRERTQETFSSREDAQAWADKLSEWRPWREYRVEEIGEGKKKQYVIMAKTAALPDGMRYVPMGYAESINAKDVERYGQRKRNDPTKPTPIHSRYHDKGLVEALVELGKTPRSFDVPTLFAKSHVDVVGARLARELMHRLRGMKITKGGVEMPAAITERDMRAIVAKQIAEERGISEDEVPLEMVDEATEKALTGPDFKDYVKVSGFNYYSPEGVYEPLYFHPDIGRPLARMSNAPIHNALMKLNSISKMLQLSLSPFHYWALAMNTLSMGENPIKAWRNWRELQKDLADDAIRHGLTLTNDVFLSGPDYRHVFEVGPTTGAMRDMLSKAENWLNEKLWVEFYRATKLASWDIQSRRFMEKGFDKKTAKRMAAQMVNLQHGGMNLDWHGIDKRLKQMLGLVMLAPDWVISNNLYSSRIVFDAGPVGDASRATFARYLAMHYIFGNIMNYLLSGHSMFENDDGKKWMVEVGGDGPAFDWLRSIGMGDLADEFAKHKYHIDIAGHMFEFFRVLAGLVDAAVPGEQFSGFERGIGAYTVGKASPLVQSIIEYGKGQYAYMPYALPSLEDIKAHKIKGRYGGTNRTPDALVWATLHKFAPLMLTGTMDAMIQRSDKFYTDARFLSGVTGRHIKEDRRKSNHKIGGGRTSRSRRQRGATTRRRRR